MHLIDISFRLGKRTGLDNVFPTNGGGRSKSLSVGTKDYPKTSDSGFGDDDPAIPAYQPPRSSIFERPGFGGLAFR